LPEKEADVLTLQGRELSWLLDGLSVDQCQAHDRFGVSIAGVKKNGIVHPDSDLILVKSAGWP
jgi:hypothetical protein